MKLNTAPKRTKRSNNNLRNTAGFVVGESHFAGAVVVNDVSVVILTASFGLNPF